MKRAYSAACEYQGDEVITFLEELRERDKYDPARDIFIFTADHGECLSYDKYGMMGHVPPALWEEIIRVPLIVSLPDWTHGTIEGQVPIGNLYDVVIETVKPRESTTTTARPEPSDLVSEIAYFVTEWEVPSTDTIHTYRGIRLEGGEKLFAGRINDENKIVFAEYTDDRLHDEVLFTGKHHQSPADPAIEERFSNLKSIAETNGPLIDGIETARGQINKDHLRDLGYLE